MKGTLEARLEAFVCENGFSGKGPLSLAVQLTETAQKEGLPLDPDSLVTGKKGQVRGLGGPRLARVLAEHGIQRRLASEAGRTSRGSIDMMRAYIECLNAIHADGLADLDAVMAFWIGRVRNWFASQPIRARLDEAMSFRALLGVIVSEAERRQRDSPGATLVGTVIQHLVGATLDALMGLEGRLAHHGASWADHGGGRAGDFEFGSVAVHVTTAPSEALLERARANLDAGLAPVIVTRGRGVDAARQLAENIGIETRVEILDFDDFMAAKLVERMLATGEGRGAALRLVIDRYNALIEYYETDPSLIISFE